MNKEFLLVPYNGDLVAANCLFNKKEKSLKILDWDFFDKEGLPLDWITFVMNLYRPTIKREMKREGLNPADYKFHGYPHLFVNSDFGARIEDYFKRMGLEKRLILPLLFMWWVKQLDDWRELRLFDPEWRRRRLFPIIEKWKDLFDKIKVDNG